VRGDATVAAPDVCVGTSGGTYVLPVNVEDTPGISQIGYGQQPNQASDFYWVPNLDGLAYPWPGAMRPTVGTRYRFEITRYYDNLNLEYAGHYRITNLSSGSWEQFNGSWPYGTGGTAWWGAETNETGSRHGHIPGATYNVNAAYLGYKYDTNGTIWYRSGMINSYYPAGSVVRDIGIPSNHQGHVITWVFGNDGVDVETY
jgi:hypothetical protein